MLNPSDFRELVSGRRRGVAAGLLRGLLRVVEVPYSSVVAWRNRRYDRGQAEIVRVSLPVVSVGNLTVGGTGKTPMVAWIARWFRQRGTNVTLISRGYKAKADSGNDEALELAQSLPDVPHIQNRDRVVAARKAIDETECQLLLLDDAFQHRRIDRDLDIVLLDAMEPFGFEHLLPRGTLRESLHGLARADIVVLSRADTIDEQQRQAIRRRVEQLAPNADWVEAVHAPQSLLSLDGKTLPLQSLKWQRVAAFCGIGNPAAFRHTLTHCHCEVVGFREFPDHHAYTQEDRNAILDWAKSLSTTSAPIQTILCTHKDLVKLENLPHSQANPSPSPSPNIQALQIGLEVQAGLDALEARLGDIQHILSRERG